ncbi:hypothetical protein PG985_010658 [Apiospora marii]|uniref:Uncharacterized protein n=1 Tax=Apiospora marii TaxID=335849 RepID=A0ABR1T3I0_9PEZI
MADTKEHLLAMVAESITAKHDLAAADVLSLADDVSNGWTTVTPFSAYDFQHLVSSLTDIDQQIPEWFGTSKREVMQFSGYQTELVLLLIETRFWHGFLTRQCGLIWHWRVVFGSAWPLHRQAVSMERVPDFADMNKKNGKLLPWVDLISNYYEEDFGVGAQVLREAYFPAGIDDARVGFTKHYNETKNAYRELEKRYRLVKKHVGSKNSLIKTCKDRLRKTGAMLPSIRKVAKSWGRNTRAQKEWWQLPGNSCGLTYGWMTRVELSSHTYELCIPDEDGKSPWRTYCTHQTPVLMEKGSSWRQFLCNRAQPDLTTVRRYRVHENAEEPDEEEGPLEVMLPQTIHPIWRKYYRKYKKAKKSVGKPQDDEDGMRDPELHSKEISQDLGEDYWMVRYMKVWDSQADYQIHNRGILKGRPRFDAADNLRLDYCNGVLKDLRLRPGDHVKDTHSEQACVVMKAVDWN